YHSFFYLLVPTYIYSLSLHDALPILLFFRQGQTLTMQYILALMGLGLALTLGVEYVVLDGDIGRQNTVFKFYMQVWLMFSVVGRSEEHTSELQSRENLVCRLLLEQKK